MDRLLLGDNQFFGINHMSEERARAQALRFQSADAIDRVIKDALDLGIRTFMCTTHEQVADIAERVRSDTERKERQVFFPCMPYAHKYANAVTEDGVLGAVRRFAPGGSLLDSAIKGGVSVARRDVDGLVRLLVDAEMRMFDGLHTPVIFLQNVVVDLLLGLGFDAAFRTFDDYVRSRYGAEPGYITMNLPVLADRLERLGIERPIICANINKLGFRMSGVSRDAYNKRLDDGSIRAIAMSVFASGAIPAREAIEWVAGLPNIESIVFGASTRAHLAETAQLVREYYPDAVAR